MPNIFISYRREDSAGYAHAIYGRLVQRFSKDQVFMDVDTVEPGVDFVRVIEDAVGNCDVLLAMIGKRWTKVGSTARSRLDDPEDFVRLEITTALAREIRVIPVLVDGMTMPSGKGLPASLKALSRRNAIEISNTRFNFDVDRLITAVRKSLDEAEAKRKAEEDDRRPVEKERTRAQQDAERRRLEEDAERKAEEERLREQERHRSGEEVKRKAEEENRRRAEEERNRAQRSPERHSLVFRDKLKDGSQGPEMVIVPAGSFQMGNIDGKGGGVERPVHRVQIKKPFAIGRYQVTFKEYDQFAHARGRTLPEDRGWGRGRRPVVHVSWNEAVEYAKWLSVQTGKPYRLLTEAEWEYAARSGGKDDIWAGTSREQILTDYAWYEASSGQKTQPVGTKKPNSIGVYDMSGNVREWVEDCWHETYDGAPEDGSAWLEAGGGKCGLRVIRGGSWLNTPDILRLSGRDSRYADFRDGTIGFRLAEDID